MLETELEGVASNGEDEPYLVFEEDNSPWWMWPKLSTTIMTRDQWVARIKLTVFGYFVVIVLSIFLWVSSSWMFVVLITVPLGVLGILTNYYYYKRGRENAMKN